MDDTKGMVKQESKKFMLRCFVALLQTCWKAMFRVLAYTNQTVLQQISLLQVAKSCCRK